MADFGVPSIVSATGPWHLSAITDGLTPIGVGGAPGERIWLRRVGAEYRAVKRGWRRKLTPVQLEVTTAGLGQVAPNQAEVERLWSRLDPRDAGELRPGIPRFWRDGEVVLSLTPPGEPKQRLYQADWYLRTPAERAADEPDVAIYLDPYWLYGDGNPAAPMPDELLRPLLMRHGGTGEFWARRKKGLMYMPETYWRPELELTFAHEREEAARALALALEEAARVLGRANADPDTLVRLSVEQEGPAHAWTIRMVDGFSDVPPDPDAPTADGRAGVPAERAYYRDVKRKLIEQGFGDDTAVKNWTV